MKLQACNTVKDIFVTPSKIFLKILSNTFQTIILRNSDVSDQSVCACQVTAEFYTICSISWKSTTEKHCNGGVLKMVALMPVKDNCVKYLTTMVNYLHAVKILQLLMKKYIFRRVTRNFSGQERFLKIRALQ